MEVKVLGRVKPQGSLLATSHARRHLVTKGSFYERLADNGDAFLCDDDYAHLYAPTMARPSIPPAIMLRPLLLATDEGTLSDAETHGNTRVDIDWQDPAARKAHLGELVAAARMLLAEAGTINDPGLSEATGLLAQVVLQDTEDDEAGNPKIRQGVAKDRIISTSDTEMRHGRKSASRKFDGYKMDVMTDEARALVLGVEIRSGSAGAGPGAAPLLDRVQAVDGIEVETLLGDMAYSDGDTRVAVEELGTELVAKVPPVTNRGLFPKTDFVIDLEASTAICPAGVTTADARPARDHKGRPSLKFVFPAEACGPCPLRDCCTKAKHASRTVAVG